MFVLCCAATVSKPCKCTFVIKIILLQRTIERLSTPRVILSIARARLRSFFRELKNIRFNLRNCFSSYTKARAILVFILLIFFSLINCPSITIVGSLLDVLIFSPLFRIHKRKIKRCLSQNRALFIRSMWNDSEYCESLYICALTLYCMLKHSKEKWNTMRSLLCAVNTHTYFYIELLRGDHELFRTFRRLPIFFYDSYKIK